MTHRLHILLDDSEFAEIRHIARRRGLTVAAWVRQALRVARREESRRGIERKLSVLREASRYSYPSGDIGAILADIGAGRFGASS
jgi:hypothetical protein